MDTRINEINKYLFGALWVGNGEPALVESDDLVSQLAQAIDEHGGLIPVDSSERSEALDALQLTNSSIVYDIYKFYDHGVNYIVLSYDWCYES